MTLLIFDVRLPVVNLRVHGVAHDLWFNEWYHYLGSFAVVGMLWLNHHFRIPTDGTHASSNLSERRGGRPEDEGEDERMTNASEQRPVGARPLLGVVGP